jgi:hypothetical protein
LAGKSVLPFYLHEIWLAAGLSFARADPKHMVLQREL